MIDQDMIKAINELVAQGKGNPVFKSLPGFPDFEWDAEASGFALPRRDEVKKLAAAWEQRIAEEDGKQA